MAEIMHPVCVSDEPILRTLPDHHLISNASSALFDESVARLQACHDKEPLNAGCSS